MHADKGKKLKAGGEMKESKAMIKKEVEFMQRKHAPKSMVHHEEAEMSHMKHGGMSHEHHMKMAHHHLKAAMKMGGGVKKYASGGDVIGTHGVDEKNGITTAKMGKAKAGGIKKFGEHSVQERGHTRGLNIGDAGKSEMIQGGARQGKGTFGAAPIKMRRGGKA
jgi:hypothetical protein